MKKRFFALTLAALLLLCASCTPAAEVTPSPTPTATPTLTPVEEATPTPDLAKEDRSVFVNALLDKAMAEQKLASGEEYETGKFISLSHNAIDSTANVFFLAVREQLENLKDVDFSVFWDPEADPAPLEEFLDNIKSFRSKEHPVIWANVSYDKVADFEVIGLEGEEVTVWYSGGIALFYPDDPQFKFSSMMIDYKLTFVCRDKCWYISAIEDLGP